MTLSFGLTGAVALLIASTGCSALASRPASAGTRPAIGRDSQIPRRSTQHRVLVRHRGGSRVRGTPTTLPVHCAAPPWTTRSPVEDSDVRERSRVRRRRTGRVVRAHCCCSTNTELAGTPDLGSNTPSWRPCRRQRALHRSGAGGDDLPTSEETSPPWSCGCSATPVGERDKDVGPVDSAHHVTATTEIAALAHAGFPEGPEHGHNSRRRGRGVEIPPPPQ